MKLVNFLLINVLEYRITAATAYLGEHAEVVARLPRRYSASGRDGTSEFAGFILSSLVLIGLRKVVRFPTLLVVWAAKVGTTSVCRYLMRHPEIYCPRQLKESFFLVREHVA